MSKLGTLILGLVKEKPLNPYEITKVMDIINITKWYKMGKSTIYSTIKNLDKKGLIKGTTIKEGNMPEKTIYAITDKGSKLFKSNITEYLSSINIDYIEYNIACIFICHLDKENVLDILNKREKELTKSLFHLDKQLTIMIKQSIPQIATTTIKHTKYLIEAEIRTNEDLIKAVNENERWDNFIIKDYNI